MSGLEIEFDHCIGTNPINNGVIFHPNGQDIISSSGGNIVIGNIIDPHIQRFLKRHDDHISAIALSPSGRYLATGQVGENSNVYVWDYETQEIMYTLEEHDHKIQSISFSHDERLLATMGNSDDRKLILWDMSNGYIVANTSRLPEGTVCMANGGFVKDIKRRDTDHYLLCTAGADGILLWDLDPYEGNFEAIKLSGDSRAALSRNILSVDFSPDRELVFGATTSGDFVIGSVRSQRILRSVSATRMAIGALKVLGSGLVLGCEDRTVKFYDLGLSSMSAAASSSSALDFLGPGPSSRKDGGSVSTPGGGIRGEVRLDGGIVALSTSHDGVELLALTMNGTITRINPATLDSFPLSESHTSAVVAVAFCEGGGAGSNGFGEEGMTSGAIDRFSTASLDGTLRVWDLAEYAVLATCHPRREQERGVVPHCLAYSDVLLSGWSDGSILAHAPDSGDNLWHISAAHPGGVSALALSHNRRFILTGGVGGEVRLWELRSRDLISHLKEHTQRVTSLALFEDDTIAISGGRDRCVLRWDLRSEKRTFCHMQRMGGINGLVLSKALESSSARTERGGRSAPRWVENGVVTVGQERRLVFWGLREADCLNHQPLGEDGDEGKCIAISHCGRYLATGGTLCEVRLWAVNDRDFGDLSLLSIGRGHTGPVLALAFSPDDRQLVSVGEDGAIFTWFLGRGAGAELGGEGRGGGGGRREMDYRK